MFGFQLTYDGATEVLESIERGIANAGPAMAQEVRSTGDQYLTTLQTEAPLGKGENPGQLIQGFEEDFSAGATSAQYNITNTTPHLHYVLDGRGRITAKPGKMLRFVSDGQVYYRKSVGPAKPNRFDERSEARMQPTLDGMGERIVTTITRGFNG